MTQQSEDGKEKYSSGSMLHYTAVIPCFPSVA